MLQNYCGIVVDFENLSVLKMIPTIKKRQNDRYKRC